MKKRLKTIIMVQKNMFFLLKLLFLIIITFSHSQSFDIYNSTIQLKDYNYNLSGNEQNTSVYNYAKSVKIEHSTNELLDPIIKLSSSEKLTLSFDILSSDTKSYAYTFIHCNSKWNYSDMNQSEYLDGFFDNYIIDYEFSFNTLTNYCHYMISFPNENINFKKSGNYILLIYDTESNNPIITKRFMIYEQLVDLKINVKKATLAKDRDKKQEVDFYIENHKHLDIKDPINELSIIIQKNDDWNDLISNCKPTFFNNKIIEYDHQGEISFFGGNEYRDFDIKSLRYYGKNIASIDKQIIQKETIYHVSLNKEEIGKSEEYLFNYDLNGKYVIAVAENKNKNTEAEYVLVKFTLNTEKLYNKDIYIYGELTNWDFLPKAKMNYDQIKKHYYGFLYLKQGYYNYQYMIKDEDLNQYAIDMDYQETRNQYSIYIYHTPAWTNYERLIGVGKSSSNSLN